MPKPTVTKQSLVVMVAPKRVFGMCVYMCLKDATGATAPETINLFSFLE